VGLAAENLLPALPRPDGSLRAVGFLDQNQKLYSVSKLATLVNLLHREGISISRALRGDQLTEQDLHKGSTRVSLDQLIRVCRSAVAFSHDPHFAFHAGQHVHLSTYGMYGFAILSSSSYRQALDFALKYFQLAVPLGPMSWRQEHGRDVWTFVPIDAVRSDPQLVRFVTEFELSILLSLHRDLLGRSFSPLEVQLPFPAPQDAPVYANMFGCAVVFGRAHAQLILNAKWHAVEPQFGNELAHAELVALCDQLLEGFRLRMGIAGMVREVLLLHRMAPIRISEVSKRLHMSERTLRRKLRSEKTSFRSVLAELRMRMAVKYLRETDLSILEIAHSLGFSEEGSFRQAFRRWSKVAPRTFRTHQARLKPPDPSV